MSNAPSLTVVNGLFIDPAQTAVTPVYSPEVEQQLDSAIEALQAPAPDIKQARIDELKAKVQHELQVFLQEASVLRHTITSAKTQVKKDYYGKKFKKVNAEVMQLVHFLQHLEQLETHHKTNLAAESGSTEVAANEDNQQPEAI